MAQRFWRWRLRLTRLAVLAPTTVVTAFAAIGVLLRHRLAAGRGTASLLSARPVGQRRSGADHPAPAAVRPAA